VPIHASRGEAEGFIHAQVNKGAGGFRRQAASARQHQVRLARTMVVSVSRKKTPSELTLPLLRCATLSRMRHDRFFRFRDPFALRAPRIN
jgi:hypothetical protein